jgi:hypothetical protein
MMIELLRAFKNKRFPGRWGFVLVFLLTTTFLTSVPGWPAAADSGYTLPPSTLLRAAAYGNGIYVVTGSYDIPYDSSTIPAVADSAALTSPDGATWTAQPASSDGPMGDIAFGNGIFVATGKYHVIATTLTSRDGVHWNSSIGDRELNSVVFGNGRFVMLGSTNNYTSTDGVNWTPIPNGAPFIDPSPQLIFSNGVFMDFSGATTQFATSTDGINWQTQDMGLIDYSGTGKIFPNLWVTGAVYGNGKYVVAATYYPSTQAGGKFYPIVITSPDGVKWTMTKLDESCYLERIAYGNGVFVATGANGGILTSPDGINWTARDTGAKTSYGTVSFCNKEFVALGAGGTISTSPDGVNWTNSRSSYQAVFTIGQSNYILNGQTYPTDAAPFIEDGRVFVPVRYLGDALSIIVGWSGNPGDQTVPLTMYTSYVSSTSAVGVTLTIGSKALTYQGSGIQRDSLTMDVAPLIRNGRTYLPARYVAEAFGYMVAWDAGSQTVTIAQAE